MGLFGRDEPAAGLFAHDVLMAVNQSANGQPALVGFGYSHHNGKVPTPGMECKIVFVATGFVKPASPTLRFINFLPPCDPAMI
jgi:hypothetical protein